MSRTGDVVAEFQSRGLIHDSTDRAELSARSTSSMMSAYVGFDPTSNSLHVGNLLGQVSLRRFQLLGHRPVVLAGGATGMVGDPSGRSEERNLLDADTLANEMQMGGSDQWGNITAGIDLIRKTLGKGAYGLTWPLVTKSDGSKFGKTADGAVWLDAERTSPYQFRQFWMQVADADIARMLTQFSLRSLEDINDIVRQQTERPESRVAQRALAREMTAMVHGEDAAEAAEQAADVLFGANPVSASKTALEAVLGEVESTTMGRAALGDVVGLLVTTGLAGSNSEARRLLSQRSVRANGEQLDEFSKLDSVALLHGRWLLLRKGKTTYHMVDFA
ncbi:MAG: tyrosine--tRNA ligase [Gammaproteobacteria bacterium]|nr:tyrosine--tRNA ligase [Gammaproteobacteria bacterium]